MLELLSHSDDGSDYLVPFGLSPREEVVNGRLGEFFHETVVATY